MLKNSKFSDFPEIVKLIGIFKKLYKKLQLIGIFKKLCKKLNFSIKYTKNGIFKKLHKKQIEIFNYFFDIFEKITKFFHFFKILRLLKLNFYLTICFFSNFRNFQGTLNFTTQFRILILFN